MSRAITVHQGQSIVVFNGGTYEVARFIKLFKLTIKYVTCETFIQGTKIVFFYTPKSNTYRIRKGQRPTAPMGYLDWKQAKITKIYMIDE